MTGGRADGRTGGKRRRLIAFALGLSAFASGCATKGMIKDLNTQIAVLRTQQARADSARAAELTRIIALQQRMLDSLGASREAMRQLRTEFGQEFLSINQQLVQVQELSGQSQARLAELKRGLDDRSDALVGAGHHSGSGSCRIPPRPPRRRRRSSCCRPRAPRPTAGSYGAARMGYREFMRLYPTRPEMADATYFLAETFVDEPDSALVYYRQVVDKHSTSSRAPTALYKTGLLLEKRRDKAGAREAFQRIIQQYPRSNEVELARGRLAALQP
jgi:tetratricopeptide (TPR) repeat protein